LKRRSRRAALAAGLLAAALACRREGTAPKGTGTTTTAPSAEVAELSYIGAAACVECHVPETALWRASDHALAMQEATDATVLGDFSGRSVTAQGVTSTFLKREGRFVVRTDGSDGRPAEFDVASVFGLRPLQQYLIRFPRGRLQALGLAWDTRLKAEGGQRWFHLYPHERVAAGDALHWTGPQQNWNFMCAECHSTNLVRHYDPASDSFATSWSEMDVACEACHGPGSRHVAWARGRSQSPGAGTPAHAAASAGTGLAVPMPRFATTDWAFDGVHPTAVHTAPPPSDTEIDSCGRCHSRRGWSWEEMVPGRPLADTHRVALLDPDLYFDDGQIREEVYEYGSFLQSPMRRRGVVCTDCHDPHSGKTRADGNALCGRCHQPSHFDAPAHHHHRAGSPGARCVSCHMPERTYMVVDPRRDHSLRVPRPDLSVALGTPNACNGCHSDRGAAWAAETVARWFPQGRSGRPHFGRALHAARSGVPGAAAGLLAVMGDTGEADIVRATALQALPHRDRTPEGAGQEPGIARAIAAAAADPSPLVRRAAADWIEPLPAAARARLGLPLLTDPVRTVRLAAAAALAGVPEEIAGAGAPALARAIEEYRRSLAFSADRAESHFNLGNLERAYARAREAETAYRQALALDPTFVPAAVNLADLLDDSGRRDEAETILRQALARDRANADLEHALGLARVRASDLAGALPHLAAAHRLRPDEARYAYVYAVALHDAGDAAAGVRILERAAARHPADADILEALVAYSHERGDDDAARRWSARLAPAAAE
jgi:predicted CXXCH cytochrome family protein